MFRVLPACDQRGDYPEDAHGGHGAWNHRGHRGRHAYRQNGHRPDPAVGGGAGRKSYPRQEVPALRSDRRLCAAESPRPARRHHVRNPEEGGVLETQDAEVRAHDVPAPEAQHRIRHH